jgi:hypothetical protein
MATAPGGSASAPKGDVMQELEVRSPTPSAGTPDLMAQVLAKARSGQAEAPPKPPAPTLRPAAPAPKSDALPELQARTPPGPQARPAAAPPALKGPPPAAPPAYVAAASAAAAKSAAIAAAAAARPAAAPTPATPPAAATPAGPPAAAALIDETAPWLPDESERRTAFLQVYRYWHAQVRPEYAHKAKPAFLFLVTALPVMVKARDTLEAQNLWEPPGEHSRQLRDQHSSWKKYCEFLPRATQALQELDDYRHLSLLTALDDLNGRITKAEKKFREGLPQTGRR